MIASTIKPGATTAAVRLIVFGKRLAHHPSARGNEHEEERPEKLGEEPSPLLARVVEVLECRVKVAEFPFDVARHNFFLSGWCRRDVAVHESIPDGVDG